MESPPLSVATFQTKKVLIPAGEDAIKKKIPQFLVGCPLMATAGIRTKCPEHNVL